jgi:hypothetical protein
LESALATAGWSTISGGGTGDVLMKTAVGPGGQSIRVRLLDPGSGNCAQITMKNNSGSLTSQTFFLLPESSSWRIVANKYSFYMFRTSAANRAAPRGVCMGGTIWIPDFVLATMGSDFECGYMQGHATTDTDTTAGTSWRNSMDQARRNSSIWTGLVVDASANLNVAQPLLMPPSLNSDNTANAGYRWQDGSLHQMEAIVGWAESGGGALCAFKGQLWDAMIVSGQAVGETTITFDGHTFIAITDQCGLSRKGIGTLYVAVD